MKRSTKLHSWFLKFDRAFSDNIWRQLLILSLIILVALIIGWIICSFLPFGRNGEKLSVFEWAAYLLIDGNALSTLYMDEYTNGGRPWVVLFAVFGSLLGVVLFGGMLISVLSNMLERRIENYRRGKNVYVISGHYVILGYDEIVPSIIKQICSDKNAYVLLQSSLPSEDIVEKLNSSIAQDCVKRVIIKNGHRTSMNDLNQLRLNKSSSIFVVGDRTKNTHDAMNIDCIEKIYSILDANKKKGLPEIVTAVFEDQDTYAAMQVTDLFEGIRSLGIEFVPYNFYAGWAKQMFIDCHYKDNGHIYHYPYLDGDGITENDSRHIHLVIIGATNFGVTIGSEAAKILHFPNFKNGKKQTSITFIDENIDEERDLFMTRHRHFFEVQSHWFDGKKIPATKFTGQNADFLDIEFSFFKGNVFSSQIQKMIEEWAADESQLLSLVFTMKDSRHNMAAAMNLPDIIYENNVPVFVHQNSSSRFLTQLHANSNFQGQKYVVENNEVKIVPQKGRYSNLYPFGMTDILFDVDKRVQHMAEYINHLYVKCKENNWATPHRQSITDCAWETIHDEWKNLEIAHQWSNLYCAYNIEYRIRSIMAMRNHHGDISEISTEEAYILGRVEHDRWNVEKLLLGYRKPAEDEDADAPCNLIDGKKVEGMKEANKTLFIHSNIRPYTELDKIQEIDKEIIRYIPWFQKQANEKS